MKQPGANALEYFRLARSLTMEGNASSAVDHYLRALDHEPDFPEALINLGILYTMLNEPVEAFRCLQRAATLDPGSPRANYNLGVALATAGRSEQAVEAFEATIKVAPNHRNALYALSVQWAKSGDRSRAQEYYRRYQEHVQPGTLRANTARIRARRVLRLRFAR